MSSSGRPQDVWKSSAAVRPAGAARGGTARKGKWFAAALAVVALGGAIAGLLFYLWPDPAPVILAMPVTAYSQPDWLPNPWAEADARGVLDRSPNGAAQTFQAQEKQYILRNSIARPATRESARSWSTSRRWESLRTARCSSFHPTVGPTTRGRGFRSMKSCRAFAARTLREC